MRTGYEKGYNVVTLKDCTAALSEEEQKSAVEKNYPMFSRPMDHNEFITELGGRETTAGASKGRGYTADAGQPSMEAPA
jgi:ureidoacrylate peracid hydrolase